MKISILWFALWLACEGIGQAYPVLSGNSSPDEQRAFAKKLQSAQTGEAGFELVEEAFSKKDAQLLKMCFEHPRTTNWLAEKLEKEKSSDLRTELVIVFLRSIREGEGSHEELAQVSRGVPAGLYLCLETIAELLPEEGLKKNDPAGIEALRESSYRFKMAAKLEEHLNGKAEPKSLPQEQDPDSPPKLDRQMPASPREAPKAPETQSVESNSTDTRNKLYWFIGGGIAIVGVCLLVATKKH